MTMLPVTDVLLIVRSTCKVCASIHEAPSPHRYRLFKAASNEPDKTELRALKDFPQKESELHDLSALPDRAIAYHNVILPWCPSCFHATMTIDTARLIRPAPPQQETTFSLAYREALTTDKGTSGRSAKRPIVALADL